MAEPGIEWFRKSAMWYSSRSTPGGGTIYGGPDGAPVPFDYDAFHENESFFGDPDECFRKIERMYEALHPPDITFLFKMGQPQDEILRSMELFAKEVMPRVRALEPAPTKSPVA